MEFARLKAICLGASQEVHERLLASTNQTISELMEGVPPPNKHCFRIPMNPPFPLHLSVSVPLDAMGNRGPPLDSSTVPECIETGLMGPDGNLMYIESLGYADIRRFYGDFYRQETFRDAIPALEAEILRLLPYAQGKKKIPMDADP